QAFPRRSRTETVMFRPVLPKIAGTCATLRVRLRRPARSFCVAHRPNKAMVSTFAASPRAARRVAANVLTIALLGRCATQKDLAGRRSRTLRVAHVPAIFGRTARNITVSVLDRRGKA